MVIKKVSANEVFLESIKDKINIKLTPEIEVNIESVEKINKPGEYEFSDINIMAVEIPKDTSYISIINFVKLNMEGIDLGILSTDSNDKEALKDIANIDILIVTPGLSIDTVRRTLTYFEPQILILFGYSDIEQAKKDFGLTNITEEKQVKIKSTDFKKDVENIITTGYLIK